MRGASLSFRPEFVECPLREIAENMIVVIAQVYSVLRNIGFNRVGKRVMLCKDPASPARLNARF